MFFFFFIEKIKNRIQMMKRTDERKDHKLAYSQSAQHGPNLLIYG